MSAQAAQAMGLRVVILDANPGCSAGQVTPFQIFSDIYSPSAVASLAEKCSVVTLENEWADPDQLSHVRALGASVVPGPDVLRIVGDKLLQRTLLAEHGLPSPRFVPLSDWRELKTIADDWGGRMVIKSRRGGYDGYGVKVICSRDDLVDLPKSPAEEWYAEEYVAFDRELAVIVSKNALGETASYPVVESRQTTDGNRCDIVIAPAPGLPLDREAKIRRIALDALEAVGGVGLFGIELFECDGTILVNEIAPRPHNSGHYTMDGCLTSQFEQHIRAARNLTPGPTDLLAPVAVMVNLLAPFDGTTDLNRSLSSVLRSSPNVHVHWYGKGEMRKGRKMGHLNLLGSDLDTTLSQATQAREAFWAGA